MKSRLHCQAKPSYKGKKNMTKASRIRITSAVCCAIRMRSSEKDLQKACKSLEKDIKKHSLSYIW